MGGVFPVWRLTVWSHRTDGEPFRGIGQIHQLPLRFAGGQQLSLNVAGLSTLFDDDKLRAIGSRLAAFGHSLRAGAPRS